MGGTSSNKSEDDLRLCRDQMAEVQRSLTKRTTELQECKIEADHLNKTAWDTRRKQEQEANDTVEVVSRKHRLCEKETNNLIDSLPPPKFATILSTGVVFRDLMKNRSLSIHNQHTGAWCINDGELGCCSHGPGTPFQLCVDPRVNGVESGSVAIACQFKYPVDWENGTFLVLTTIGTVRVVRGYPANDRGAAWRLGAVSGPAGPMVIFFARHDDEEKIGWMLSNSVGTQNVKILKDISLSYMARLLPERFTSGLGSTPILAWNVDVR